jgi:hypothetical protein
VHVTASVALVGIETVMLTAALLADRAAAHGDTATAHACYQLMLTASLTTATPSAVLATATGIALALGHTRRLLPTRWLQYKLALLAISTLLATGVSLPTLLHLARTPVRGPTPPAARQAATAITQIAILATASALSVAKPGRRRRKPGVPATRTG